MYGVILGMMGVGGVTSGMLLPLVRGRIDRGTTVVGCTLFSCTGIAVVGLSRHWLPAALGMLLFGSAGRRPMPRSRRRPSSSARPGCVRARLSIYQLAQNGALTVGSFAWGGSAVGRPVRHVAGRRRVGVA